MNLKSKKNLAKKTLGLGKRRIIFVEPRLEEIKEAITKQDIKSLVKDGAIVIRPGKGRKTVMKKKRARGVGKVKKKVNKRKERYVKLTRKLRKHMKGLKDKGEINNEDFKEVRKKIRNSVFRSLSHLKENLKKK